MSLYGLGHSPEWLEEHWDPSWNEYVDLLVPGFPEEVTPSLRDPVSAELWALRGAWERFYALRVPSAANDRDVHMLWFGLARWVGGIIRRIDSILGGASGLPWDIQPLDDLLGKLEALRARRGGDARSEMDAIIGYVIEFSAMVMEAKARAK